MKFHFHSHSLSFFFLLIVVFYFPVFVSKYLYEVLNIYEILNKIIIVIYQIFIELLYYFHIL